MGFTKVGTPVASSNGQDGKFGNDDGGPDGSCDFFRCLDTETDVALAVANDHNGLESGSLTGTSLLLDGFDLGKSSLLDRGGSFRAALQPRASHLHNFILQLGQEPIDDLVLLDGQ